MRPKEPSSVTVTQRELDCLIAIEALSKTGWPARTTDIARTLEVKGPSAVEIVSRLQRKSLLEKGPGGAKISKLGLATILEVHRSHRILETMLTRIGMRPEKACVESKRIERSASRELTRAMCSFLGHPRTCPDNMPIEPDPRCCGLRLKEE